MKQSAILVFVLVAGVCSAWLQSATARTPDSFVPLSISYSWPSDTLARGVDAQPALGFSLGYAYGSSKHLRLTTRATWMRMQLGTVVDAGDTLDFSDFGLTHVGIVGGLQYRFFKHDFSPYVAGEAGLGIVFADMEVGNVPQRIDGLSEVKFSYALSAGVLIPLNETIDIDVYGRYQTTFTTDRLTALSAHVGVVYAL